MVEQFFGAPLRRSQKHAPFKFPVAAAYPAGAALRLNDVVKNCTETVSNPGASRATPEPQIWPLDGWKCSGPSPCVKPEKTALGRGWRALQRGFVPALSQQLCSASCGMIYRAFGDRTGPVSAMPATRAHGGPSHQRAPTRGDADRRPRSRSKNAGDGRGLYGDGQGWPGMVWDGLAARPSYILPQS